MTGYFKYLINPAILKPIIILLIICLIGTFIFSSRVKAFRKKRKKFLIYVLLSLVVVALYQIVLHNIQQTTLLFRYYGLLSFFIITGSVHVYLYRTMFESLGYENSLKVRSILAEILLSMLEACFLLISITLVTVYFKDDTSFLYYLYITTIAFIFPTIVYLLFEASLSIPVKLYTKWYYPLTKKYSLIGHNELKNIIVLNFLFYKGYEKYYLTKFKIKAPKDVNFGRLFYSFIEDYNEKHVGDKIEIYDPDGNPYGWYFYTRPKLLRRSRHIDADLSVVNNDLKDNYSIICQRA